jgi:DNA invertase Pin-like site-specific DNA recombinase
MLTDPQLSPGVRPRPLRAERLARLSTEEQNSLGRAGLQAQYNQVDAAIAAHGYQVVGTTEIIDVSGTNVTMHCPAFLNLLERVKTGEVQVVVCSEISRVCRPDNLGPVAAVLDVPARHNCLINAAGSEINFSNPEGFIAGGLAALMAGHVRMTFMRRVHEAKEINRKRGWLASSDKTLALGISYNKETRKFFYNDEIHRVAEGFRLMDEERLSLSAIGRRIGVHPANVRGVLENEIYSTGYKVYDQKCDLSVKSIGPGGKQRARPKIVRSPDEIIRVKVICRFNRALRARSAGIEGGAVKLHDHQHEGPPTHDLLCDWKVRVLWRSYVHQRQWNASQGWQQRPRLLPV